MDLSIAKDFNILGRSFPPGCRVSAQRASSFWKKTRGYRDSRTTTERLLPLEEFQKPRPANRHGLRLQARGRVRAGTVLYEH
jgi:hypothetical protein